MKKLKKIWTDPVWSKVISAGIIALIVLIWSFVSAKVNDINFWTAWKNFWAFEIRLWWLTVGIVLVLLFIWTKKYYSQTVSFLYDDETLKLDRLIFEKIRNELLPQTGAIYFLRHNNFAGFSFDNKEIDELDKFEDECRKSDFEFLNPSLEKIRIELFNSIDHFTTQIAGETFPTHNGRQTVPPEWEDEQPERFWSVVDELHKTKFDICSKYDELIKSGRRILKI
ncbi:hypothetical protein ACR79H_12905 [Sphingobacterium spiritivorum]|uniref:hypothetical protein n=1 Tax=Sphingobacterium spiritivorum TaxID=258 RepID=UPI003DA4BA1E